MPLKRVPSNASNAGGEERPGPLSGPSTTDWRRQRLLQIGQAGSSPAVPGVPEAATGETSALRPAPELRSASYGTLPAAARTSSGKQKSSFRARHALGALPSLLIPKGRYTNPPTPSVHSPRSLRASYFSTQRPISAYDGPVVANEQLESEGIKTNGIRVWYSSFTSIDWLHDAIKDSARQGVLRKRKSKRGRFLRQLDRSIGWITVTFVGFFTAITAFMIVRSEQWLFDIKEGHCTTGIWKAKRFCCPVVDEDVLSTAPPAFLSMALEEACPAWQTWGEYFTPVANRSDWLEVESIEYVVYIIIAVCIALYSTLSVI